MNGYDKILCSLSGAAPNIIFKSNFGDLKNHSYLKHAIAKMFIKCGGGEGSPLSFMKK